jgi:hypothetical protein
MSLAFAVFKEKSGLKSLLDHFSVIDDPREPWRVAHPLGEVLLRKAPSPPPRGSRRLSTATRAMAASNDES